MDPLTLHSTMIIDPLRHSWPKSVDLQNMYSSILAGPHNSCDTLWRPLDQINDKTTCRWAAFCACWPFPHIGDVDGEVAGRQTRWGQPTLLGELRYAIALFHVLLVLIPRMEFLVWRARLGFELYLFLFLYEYLLSQVVSAITC